VTIHAGQCGVQCAPAFWSMMKKEHFIDEKGGHKSEEPVGACKHAVFRENSSGIFRPRVVILDLDPSTVDCLRTNVHKRLFTMEDMITGVEDGASCYARARYVQGYDIIPKARQQLRRQLEACGQCAAVIHNCATSGGTGSGIVPDILTVEDSKKNYVSMGIEVYCSPGIDNTLGYYNTVLHMNSMNDFVEVNVMVDNDSLYKVGESRYRIGNQPDKLTFQDINQEIAAIFSSLTLGERFTTQNIDIQRFMTGLVPYMGLSYITATISPYQESPFVEIPVKNLVHHAFSRYSSCSLDRTVGQYLGSYIVLRGKRSRVGYEGITRIHRLCEEKRFASWIPCKLTIGQCETTIPKDFKPFMFGNTSVSHFYNHSSVTTVFDQYSKWFGVSYTKKAFVDWYLNNGMQETEFEESLQSVHILQRVYDSVGKSEAQKEEF